MEVAVNIIWDLGGTLIDTYTPLDEMLFEQVRDAGADISFREISLLTRAGTSAALETIAQRYGIDPVQLRAAHTRLKQSWTTEPAPLNAGAAEALAKVHDADGLNLVITHRDRASATTLIRQHNLPIDHMICAPDGFARKPDPDMFHAMIEQTDVSADALVSVGDREIDIEASHAAGIRAALLETPGIHFATDAEWRITDLLQIFDHI